MRGVAITLEGRPLTSYSILGARGFARLLAAKLHIGAASKEFDVYPPGSGYPVRLRFGTSDIATYMQIFRDLEYELPDVECATTIIDCGANIGLSAIFFAQRYPGADIIAIEPEETNFRLLKRNTSPYGRIVPLQAALWRSNGTIDVVDPGEGKWAYRVAQAHDAQDVRVNGQRVEAVTVDTVMERFGLSHVDILKMDIEGAEKEVFEGAPPWLSKVGMIAVELHDRFKVGCSRSFYDATSDFDVEWRRGDLVFVKRTDATSARTGAREMRG
jgi:FkbM family methyltransferase